MGWFLGQICPPVVLRTGLGCCGGAGGGYLVVHRGGRKAGGLDEPMSCSPYPICWGVRQGQ